MSIQDAPRVSGAEGGEILAIPTRIENEFTQVIIQCDQGEHGRNGGGDHVQIIERVACVSKVQMITLSENGMKKLQQCTDYAERQIEEEKWRVFVGNIWGCLMNRITEKVCELRTMFNEDVQMKLEPVCVKCTGWT